MVIHNGFSNVMLSINLFIHNFQVGTFPYKRRICFQNGLLNIILF